MCDRNDGIKLRERGDFNPTLFNSRENHRSIGKNLRPVPLDKDGRWRTEGHNQVRWLFAIKSTKVLDEGDFRILIARTGRYERLVLDIQRPW